MRKSIRNRWMVVVAGVGVGVLGVAGAASAQGDVARGQKLAATCAVCHGPGGNSSVPEWPKLAGLHEAYIVSQLQAYQAGTRQDPIMAPLAKPLNEQDMHDLGAYYASQTMSNGVAPPAGAGAEGLWIYQNGLHASRVAACKACHAPTGMGHPAAGFPRLGGQHAAYTAATLRAFRTGLRTDPDGMMTEIAGRMSDADIEAVAAYVAGLSTP